MKNPWKTRHTFGLSPPPSSGSKLSQESFQELRQQVFISFEPHPTKLLREDFINKQQNKNYDIGWTAPLTCQMLQTFMIWKLLFLTGPGYIQTLQSVPRVHTGINSFLRKYGCFMRTMFTMTCFKNKPSICSGSCDGFNENKHNRNTHKTKF